MHQEEQTQGVVISTPQVSLYDPHAQGPGAEGDGYGGGVYSRRWGQEEIGPAHEPAQPAYAKGDSSLVTFSAASLPRPLGSRPHSTRPAPAGPLVHEKERGGSGDDHNGDANDALLRAMDLWNNHPPRKTGSKTIVVTATGSTTCIREWMETLMQEAQGTRHVH
jgi:hypothetical protein